MNNKIYYKNRGENIPTPTCSKTQKKKIKFDFRKFKKNTVCSLNEVECFLNSFNKIFKGIKLYKIIK